MNLKQNREGAASGVDDITPATKYRHACLPECRPAALSSVADGRPSAPSSALHADIHSSQSLSTFNDRSNNTVSMSVNGNRPH